MLQAGLLVRNLLAIKLDFAIMAIMHACRGCKVNTPEMWTPPIAMIRIPGTVTSSRHIEKCAKLCSNIQSFVNS